jgi:hypothetical protein
MKICCDRDPFIAEVKNGAFQAEPGRFAFIVTSKSSIEKCFSWQQDQAAIKRRPQEIEMTEENKILLRKMRVDLKKSAQVDEQDETITKKEETRGVE